MANIRKIRRKAMAFTIGSMDADMRVGGTRESSMALEPILTRLKRMLNMGFGRTVSELNGLMKRP